jgi:hypothetical protein
MVTTLVLGVSEADADDLQLEELALQLRDELLSAEVESVEQLAVGPPAEGTRALGALAVGSLVASMDPAKLVDVIHTVVSWLRRGSAGRTVKVQIGGDVLELRGVNDAIQQQLVDNWVQRHSTA